MALTDVVVEIRITAPVGLVYKVFTTPDGLDQVWTKKSQIDARQGGRFAFWYEDPTSPAPDATGTFVEVVPDRRLILHFDQDDDGPDPSPVTVAFHPDERGGTKVEITHADLDDEDEESLEELSDGWDDVLAKLKAVAERWQRKALREAEEVRGWEGGRPPRDRKGASGKRGPARRR